MPIVFKLLHDRRVSNFTIERQPMNRIHKIDSGDLILECEKGSILDVLNQNFSLVSCVYGLQCTDYGGSHERTRKTVEHRVGIAVSCREFVIYVLSRQSAKTRRLIGSKDAT